MQNIYTATLMVEGKPDVVAARATPEKLAMEIGFVFEEALDNDPEEMQRMKDAVVKVFADFTVSSGTVDVAEETVYLQVLPCVDE